MKNKIWRFFHPARARKLNRYLIDGITFRDINQVLEAIKKGADVRCKNDLPSIVAWMNRNTEALMILHSHGAPIWKIHEEIQ